MSVDKVDINIVRHCEGGTTEAILHTVEIASGKNPRNDALFKGFFLIKRK